MKQKTSKKAGFEKFIEEISSDEVSPVYIFKGDQIHLIDKALHELREKVLGGADDMNYVVLHGDSTSAEEITGNASTVPMFTKKKVIVVKNAEKLKAKDLTSLELYFESPSPLSCVVIIFSDGKAPKIKKKSLPTFDFSLEKGNTVAAVREEAQRLGCKITTRAAQTLISLVGEDLQELHNELEKLSLYRAEGTEIDIEDIEKHTRKAQFGDVFALINAISKRNKKEAHRVLLDSEEQGEEPLAVLSRIIWRFRLIWKAKELTDKKTPKPELLKELKMSPGAFYYLSEDLKKYSYDDITRIIGLLSECDKKLKMSYVPRKYQLTKLVTELFSKSN